MTEVELHELLQKKQAFGIAIIGGNVSGNFETFDVDAKNDLTGQLLQDLFDVMEEQCIELLDKLPIALTPSGGIHFYYRLINPSNSVVLAKRELTDLEKEVGVLRFPPVLIETRSSRQYAIIPPTPGYIMLQGSLNNVPVLTLEEQQTLWACGKQFNNVSVPNSTASISRTAKTYCNSPYDDYNLRGDVLGLLVKHGWTILPTRHDRERIYLKRPGNTKNKNSANFHLKLNLFKVFSSSTVFVRGKAYKPYAVYAILECGCDFRLAAKMLILAGYGLSYKEQRMLQGK